jgi:hypothetical protein
MAQIDRAECFPADEVFTTMVHCVVWKENAGQRNIPGPLSRENLLPWPVRARCMHRRARPRMRMTTDECAEPTRRRSSHVDAGSPDSGESGRSLPGPMAISL